MIHWKTNRCATVLNSKFSITLQSKGCCHSFLLLQWEKEITKAKSITNPKQQSKFWPEGSRILLPYLIFGSIYQVAILSIRGNYSRLTCKPISLGRRVLSTRTHHSTFHFHNTSNPACEQADSDSAALFLPSTHLLCNSSPKLVIARETRTDHWFLDTTQTYLFVPWWVAIISMNRLN